MTTTEIDATLDNVEVILTRLAELAPRILALQNAAQNGQLTVEQLERYAKLNDFLDSLNAHYPE